MAENLKIDTDAVKRQFDDLVDQGELFIGPTEPFVEEHAGINFEFRIVNHFKDKPQVSLDGKSRTTAQSAKRPPPTDGSDIDHSDPAFFVAQVNNTHKLILNKFCVFRPQYILLTQNPKCRQQEPLEMDDWRAAWTTLQALGPTPHYVIFNGGIAAGSSRNHKHMQLLEMPGPPNAPLVVPEALPCHFFKHDIDSMVDDVPDHLFGLYTKDMRDCRRLLGIDGENDLLQQAPHNIVMTRDWFVVVPRRLPTIDALHGHIINAIGMLGLVWTGSKEQLQGWHDAGPAEVLRQLGVARE